MKWSEVDIRIKPDVMTSFPFHDKCTWIPKSGANLAGGVILFGRDQKNHLELWSIKTKYDLGGHFLRSFWYRIHLPPNSFSSKIIKTFMFCSQSWLLHQNSLGLVIFLWDSGIFSSGRKTIIFWWFSKLFFFEFLSTKIGSINKVIARHWCAKS